MAKLNSPILSVQSPYNAYQIFPKLISIGYVQRTIGFKGQIHVQLDCPPKPNSGQPAFVWFLQFGKPVPFQVIDYQVEPGGKVKMLLEDIIEEHDALALKNLTCLIEENLYDKYFETVESYDYLFGFMVIDNQDGELGIVEDVFESENGHDNLLVFHKNKEIYIPFIEPIITKIDELNKKIYCNLPLGLIKLYLK